MKEVNSLCASRFFYAVVSISLPACSKMYCVSAVQVIPMDESGQLFEAFNARLEELSVIDACMMAGTCRIGIGR